MGFSNLTEMKATLRAQFRDIISMEDENYNRLYIDLENKDVVPIIMTLKNFMNFEHLSMISCVDWLEEGKFELIYILTSYKRDVVTMLKTKLDRDKPNMQSIMNLWPQAVTYEIELNEMFGVHFEGNNRMGEEFILEDWDDIPPMRRDFDTMKYANENFSFRSERCDSKKVVRDFISERYDEWRKE